MYSERMIQDDTNSSPNEVEQPPSPDKHTGSPLRAGPRKLPDTRILILGPSGVGKSSASSLIRFLCDGFCNFMLSTRQLINLLTNEGLQVASEGMGLCTTRFWALSNSVMINNRPFRLIDSPGFNTATLSNADILEQLVVFLAKARDKYHAKLSGVLYLHPQGDDLACEQLKQNLHTLTHLFGEPWLPHFIFAVVGTDNSTESDAIHQLQDPSSPFHPLHLMGAKFRYLPFDLSHSQSILSEFIPAPTSDARFYSRVRWFASGRVTGLDLLMEEVLGSQRAVTAKKTGRLAKVTLEESETSRHQLQATLNATEAELKSLRSQLEQTQSEYASLRSELQLNDNTEQSKVVQSLQDLNRAIDDFGRSVAEYVVDDFAPFFNKDEPTTLDASDLPELQNQFGHSKGMHSLATSADGNGLPIEDFVDLALRNFLCQMLCKNVFDPFHPTLLGSAQSSFMSSLYKEIRSQGSPTVAAKWRASSFLALSQGHKLEKSMIEQQVESLMAGDIQQLLNNLFGQSTAVVLKDSQRGQLQDIVTAAWELNHALKGEIVTLGDFHPLFYERGVPFDPRSMKEFEASKKRTPGDIAICTIRLGLTLSHFKGAGMNSVAQVICPTTVVTPTVFG